MTFVGFWLQHGETLQASAPYAEAAAHLVLMAFLHCVANGGGRLDREYALGTRRLDPCLTVGDTRLAVEVKTWRDGDKSADPTGDGIAQLDAYLARLGASQGWLVVFDQRSHAASLPERLRREAVVTPGGRRVEVLWL